MMRRIAGVALGAASMFLALMAIMLDSMTLFYMGTALITTLLAARLQAFLAIRGLKFTRVAPEAVKAGELVTVEITVQSERKIRRPLITILDNLPGKLRLAERTPSLPVAPAYDMPVRTQYQFRALRRGKFRWSGLTVVGTDALGLVTMSKHYTTTPAEITVLPAPIPVAAELPLAAGWGISEAESGKSRGAGLEPRGVREYMYGDSLRHIHWRSSARAQRLLVKEFEAGSHAVACFVLQQTQGTDVGGAPMSSLDLMCGHAVYLSDQFQRQGIRVEFPGLETGSSFMSPWERLAVIQEVLAGINADKPFGMGEHLLQLLPEFPTGGTIFLMLVNAEPTILDAIAHIKSKGYQVVAMVYDSSSFSTKVRNLAKTSAATGEFMSRLQAVGAETVLMPSEVSL
jgi:uncharacterized protein (DUF58 family)